MVRKKGCSWNIPKEAFLKYVAKKSGEEYDSQAKPTPTQLSRPYWDKVNWEPEDVMDYLNISYGKLWGMLSTGQIPGAFQV